MIEDLDRLMQKEGVDVIVAEGTAFEKPDIYWLTGFCSPDSVICYHAVGEETVVATGFITLERILKESFIKRTYDITEIQRDLSAKGKKLVDYPDLTYGPLLKSLFTGKVIGAPDHLPASVVVALQQMGHEVKPLPHILQSARARKTVKEIKSIKRAGDATIGALARVVDVIKDADIGPNKTLLYKKKPLTVGDLKLAMDHFLLDRRAESVEDAILAVGTKGFDWHYLGRPKDPLKAEVPIIIDVFPRLKLDRYVADITRTVVKGKVSKKLQDMYDAVAAAAGATVDALTDGAVIDHVNMTCYNKLKSLGFDSRRLNPHATEGMTHGLGHGIGLEVHEDPSFQDRTDHFASGHVMAIEPGVYMESIGGVRIENDYEVTTKRARLLTKGLEDVLFV